MVKSPCDAHRWWGEFQIPRDRAGQWQVGPLRVWVESREHEWRLAWEETEGEPPDDRVAVACPAEPEEPPATAAVERVASRRPGERLLVSARLADRSIVSRPETRFRLTRGDEVSLYVGTPLWLRVEEAADPPRRLLEVPVLRPSETWFGPSTTEGELCYASRTSARLHLDNLPPKPYRALTEVRLRNRGSDDLVLERINLPVPELALFADAECRLWTQSVTVERGADDRLAEVRIDASPPAAAAEVSGPRIQTPRNVFSRALSGLLS